MTNECGQEAEQRSGYGDKQVEQWRVLYVRERILYSMRSLTLSQWIDLRIGDSGVRELGSFNNCTSKGVLDVLKHR